MRRKISKAAVSYKGAWPPSLLLSLPFALSNPSIHHTPSHPANPSHTTKTRHDKTRQDKTRQDKRRDKAERDKKARDTAAPQCRCCCRPTHPSIHCSLVSLSLSLSPPRPTTHDPASRSPWRVPVFLRRPSLCLPNFLSSLLSSTTHNPVASPNSLPQRPVHLASSLTQPPPPTLYPSHPRA